MGDGMEEYAGTVRRRVLVIDDDVRSANGLRLLLELEGFEARVAHDAEAGLASARAFVPDVVLCDLGLPTMDGFELARVLRLQPEVAAATLVALTGYNSREVVAQTAAAGFDAHFTKPIIVRDLLTALATLRRR